MKSIFLKITLLLATFFAFTSCDKDFNSLGSDLVDDTHFDLEKYDGATVVAYSKATGPVQSNNLSVNSLGIYKNPVFGTTTSHFVTQIELGTTNPNVGTNITIDPVKDSVYLYIPYFSHLDKDATEADTYVLDSIYGDRESTFNLKIYRNGYTLRDFSPNPDPNDITSYKQKYYNNDKSLVEGNIASAQINNSTNVSENTSFKFNKSVIIKYKTDANGNFINNSGDIVTDIEDRVVEDKFEPGMWINLDKEFFRTQVLQAPSGSLLNNSVFADYFKGLYFQVEENAGQNGVMAMLDFSKGKIYIEYHSDITTTTSAGSTTTNDERELILNLKGNTINFFDYENNTAYQNYQTNLNNSDEVNGDSRLYLKGGEGSVVYIDLFGTLDVQKFNDEGVLISGSNGVPDELDELRVEGKLVNEANLVFYIDNSVTGMDSPDGRPEEPKRIYLFDATNQAPILDYLVDSSTRFNTKENKYNFDGIIQLDETDKGTKYKIRITNYINRIINDDDDELNKNLTLGLSVTENIAVSSNASLKSPITVGSNQIKHIPFASVMNPLGTVLYGTNIAPGDINEDKKLKLEIYFTKPN